MSGMQAATMVGLFLSLLLGGCLDEGPGHGDPQAIRLDGDQPCDPAVVANCAEVDANPAAPYVLRPVRLGPPSATMEETVGVHIFNLHRGAVVRDLSLEGFDIGIKVENATCTQCTLVVERVTIRAAPPKVVPLFRLSEEEGSPTVSDFLVAHGILVTNGPAAMIVSDVSIVMAGGGVVNELESGISFWGGSTGIDLGNTNATILLSNVSIESTTRSARAGIRFAGWESALQASEVTVSGFTTCVQGIHRELSFEDLVLEDCRTAMDLYSRGNLTLTRFNVGQSKFGIQSYVPLYHEPDLRVSAIVDNGLVTENEVNGLLLSDFASVEISDVAFIDNGKEYEANRWDPDQSGGLVLYNTPGTIRGSQFVGNIPFGLATPGNGLVPRIQSLDVVDARDNWWGSPMGPRFQAQDTLPMSPGDGDGVAEGVVFAPFLTSP